MPGEDATDAPAEEFELRGDYIELDSLLKLLGIAPSGGAAKKMVADGMVMVDDRVELRKTRKLRAGSRVRVGGRSLRIVAAGN